MPIGPLVLAPEASSSARPRASPGPSARTIAADSGSRPSARCTRRRRCTPPPPTARAPGPPVARGVGQLRGIQARVRRRQVRTSWCSTSAVEQAERGEQPGRGRDHHGRHLQRPGPSPPRRAGRCRRTQTARSRADRGRARRDGPDTRIMFDAAIRCAPYAASAGGVPAARPPVPGDLGAARRSASGRRRPARSGSGSRAPRWRRYGGLVPPRP